MTLRDPDSPLRRMALAIGGAAAIMVAAGLVYYFVAANKTISKFNGAAIVAAAQDYTRDMNARKQPLPKTITLEELVALHFLKPGQIEAFRGLKATVILATDEAGPVTVLMRVDLPDGGEILLRSDGSVQEVSR